MTTETARNALAYLVAIGLLSYYGTEVCPFLDSLTAGQQLAVHGPDPPAPAAPGLRGRARHVASVLQPRRAGHP